MAWNVPSTFVALATLTAAQLNQIRDSLKAIGDPWTAYTPTMGVWTLPGSLTGHWRAAGKDIEFRIKYTAGASSTWVGSPTFTLPTAATAARTVNAVVLMYDSSAAAATGYKVGGAFNSSTTTLLVRDDASAVLSATNPFPWATGDELVITGSYEAA